MEDGGWRTEFPNRELALAEMISLVASFDKASAIGFGESQPVLNDGEGNRTCCLFRALWGKLIESNERAVGQ